MRLRFTPRMMFPLKYQSGSGILVVEVCEQTNGMYLHTVSTTGEDIGYVALGAHCTSMAVSEIRGNNDMIVVFHGETRRVYDQSLNGVTAANPPGATRDRRSCVAFDGRYTIMCNCSLITAHCTGGTPLFTTLLKLHGVVLLSTIS